MIHTLKSIVEKRKNVLGSENSRIFSLVARSPSQLGHSLKRFRLKEKLTQSELSERAGVRQATISNLERGHSGVELETVFKVFTALELEISLRERREEQ